jgi:hypothetical protein
LASQQRLASPMLNEADSPGIPDPTNSPPQYTPDPPVLLDPGSFPTNGNFFMLVETNWPPFPNLPCPGDVFALSDGSFLVNDEGYLWQTNADSGGGGQASPRSYTNSVLELEITGVTNSIISLILHGTTSTAYTIQSRRSLSTNDQWMGELPLTGADGQTPFQVPTYDRRALYLRAHLGTDPLGLWLRTTGISNNCLNAILQGTAEGMTYGIRSTTSLQATNNWAIETNFPGASGQFWTPVSIPMAGRPSLFLSAYSWIDSTGSGIPDWWLLQYFGSTAIDPYALCPSGDGWTIGQAYEYGWNPTNFYTPPPPRNVSARLGSTGADVVITWASGGGPVTNYVIKVAWIDSVWGPQVQTVGQTGASTFALAYSPGSWLLAQPGPALSYSVSAYFANGTHADSVQAPLWKPSLTPTMSVVRGPTAGLYLTVSSPLPSPSRIRLFWFSPTDDTLWIDVDATNVLNGIMRIPQEQMASYVPGQEIDVRVFATDVDFGPISCLFPSIAAEELTGGSPVPPTRFVDARRHLKENLKFLLQSATLSQPFSYGPGDAWNCDANSGAVWSPETQFARPPSPTNYEYSGFHVFSSNLNYSVMQEFRPAQENYLWRNLAYDAGDFDSSGNWTNGVGYCTSLPGLRFLTNPNYQFTCTNCDPLPLALSVSSHPYLFVRYIPAATTLQDLLRDLTEIGVGMNCTNIMNVNCTMYLPTGMRNVYGLPISSLMFIPDESLSFLPHTLNPGDAPVVRGIMANYFCDVDSPVLETRDYYFASQTPYFNYGTPRPPLPGSPDFSVTNTSPLLITGLGQPITVAGWAKQEITNGYSGKYAYLEQYFTNANTIGPNGVAKTNSAGLLSPYGEFFPMQPGPAALVTMPDIDHPDQQGTGVVNVIKLQLDVNHDGAMDLSFGGPDNTSQAQPFVFWINDDCDSNDAGHNPAGEDVQAGPVMPPTDYTTERVNSWRDLEDYARLWICGVPPLTNGAYQVTLSWTNVSSGSPSIILFQSVEADGGTRYLTDTNVAAAQSGLPINSNNVCYAFATVSSGQTFAFPANFFTNNANRYFLFEGASPGSGELMLTISQNGQTIAQTGSWLDLHKIEDFYEQVEATNVTSSYPPSDLASQYSVVHYGSGVGDETKQVIVYVHGINRPTWDAQNEGETLFKRLYWSGYHGHFAMFKWPCTYLPPNNWWPWTFNLSEFYAYKSATALKNYLTDLRNRPDVPGYAINVLAHSQGSAVVSEALSQGAPFDNCILTQGAVPAHCYDGDAPSLPSLLAADEQKPTPFYAYEGGYYQCWTNISGNIVNFYNTNDFALVSGSYFVGLKRTNWEINQETQKPEWFALGPSYSYWPASGTSSRSTFSGSQQVTDLQEIRSMVARSRTAAIGAQGPGDGQTRQGVINGSVDLLAVFQFGYTRPEHSAQFTRPIQAVWGYYDEILLSFGMQSVKR